MNEYRDIEDFVKGRLEEGVAFRDDLRDTSDREGKLA